MGFDPMTMALANAGLSIGSGMLSGSPEPTQMQKTKQNVVDQLLQSLSGQGPYSGLFGFDQDSFQKSFVDPAKSMFKNQIAPQIQQSYMAGDQQRSSGLSDQLLRAGVDLDQMLNQQMMQYQEAGKNRAFQGLTGIMGMGDGPAQPLSFMDKLGQSTQGFVSSNAFGDIMKSLTAPPRKGFQSGSLTT